MCVWKRNAPKKIQYFKHKVQTESNKGLETKAELCSQSFFSFGCALDTHKKSSINSNKNFSQLGYLKQRWSCDQRYMEQALNQYQTVSDWPQFIETELESVQHMSEQLGGAKKTANANCYHLLKELQSQKMTVLQYAVQKTNKPIFTIFLYYTIEMYDGIPVKTA